jgi:ankyrin repeat protein
MQLLEALHPDFNRCVALMDAIWAVKWTLVQSLVLEDPDACCAADTYGILPLGIASICGGMKMVKVLIEHGNSDYLWRCPLAIYSME